jgi:hypothetical protein
MITAEVGFSRQTLQQYMASYLGLLKAEAELRLLLTIGYGPTFSDAVRCLARVDSE